MFSIKPFLAPVHPFLGPCCVVAFSLIYTTKGVEGVAWIIKDFLL